MSEPPFRHIGDEGGTEALGGDGMLPRRPSASILRTGSRSDLAALNEDDSGDESAMQYQPQQFRRERSMEDKKRASFSQQGPERFEFTPGSAPGGKIVQEGELVVRAWFGGTRVWRGIRLIIETIRFVFLNFIYIRINPFLLFA